jgi:hypothetical protein
MAQAAPSNAYFSHVHGGRFEGAPLQSGTRFLCAAAYLDDSFARKVLREFVEEDHRGVVPSFGFDVAPVIAHCLRARRMRLFRDATIAVVLFLAVLVHATAVALLCVVLLPVAVLPFMWSRYGPAGRVLLAGVLAVPAAVAIVGVDPVSVLNAIGPGDGRYFYVYEEDAAGAGPGFAFWLAATLAIAAAVLVPLGHRFMVYRALRGLGPGSRQAMPQAVGRRVRQTLERVSSAQRGNLTLYSHENPFLGSGQVGAPWSRAWSITLELDRVDGPPGSALNRGPRPRNVDPVDLHRHVHERLVAMRDEIPPHERVSGLLVDWHVVAQGQCPQGTRPVDTSGNDPYFHGHPLIDAERSVPYSWAGDETVSAIIQHPQADVRCYQRVTVGTYGQAVRDRMGRPIAPAGDQDVLLSAFLYLAVEGRMLYAQFVANLMPPIRRGFRVVDDLPAYTTQMIAMLTLRRQGTRALGEGLLAPARLAGAAWQVVRRTLETAGRAPAAFPTYDYGARISVREEAAEPGPATFLQTLDADKYTKLIERRVNEAVLGYLRQCDVDVTAYREQAAMVLNDPFITIGHRAGSGPRGAG